MRNAEIRNQLHTHERGDGSKRKKWKGKRIEKWMRRKRQVQKEEKLDLLFFFSSRNEEEEDVEEVYSEMRRQNGGRILSQTASAY